MKKIIMMMLCTLLCMLIPAQAFAAPAEVSSDDTGNTPVSVSYNQDGTTLAVEINRTLNVDSSNNYIDITLDVDISAASQGAAGLMPRTADTVFPLILIVAVIVVAALMILIMWRRKKSWHSIASIVVALALLMPLTTFYGSRQAHAVTANSSDIVTEAFSQDMLANFTFDSILSSTSGVQTVTTGGVITGFSWEVSRESHNQAVYRMRLNADVDDSWLNRAIPVTSISKLDYVGLDGSHKNLDFPSISVILKPITDSYRLIVEHYFWDGTTATPIDNPVTYDGLQVGSTYQAQSYVLSDPSYAYLDHVVTDNNGTWFAHSEQTEVTVTEDQHNYSLKLYYGKPASFAVSASYTEYTLTLNAFGSAPNYDRVTTAPDVSPPEYLQGWRDEGTTRYYAVGPFAAYHATTNESLMQSSGEFYVGESIDITDYLQIQDPLLHPEIEWLGTGTFIDGTNTYNTTAFLGGSFVLVPGQTFVKVLATPVNNYSILYQPNSYFLLYPPPPIE